MSDKLGTPTYAGDFARCLLGLIDTGSYGLYHMAYRGHGTRYDVAKKILEVLGRAEDVTLVEVGSDYFRESYPAPRPRSEMMRNLMLDLQGLNTVRAWQDALEEYLVTVLPGKDQRRTRPTSRRSGTFLKQHPTGLHAKRTEWLT